MGLKSLGGLTCLQAFYAARLAGGGGEEVAGEAVMMHPKIPSFDAGCPPPPAGKPSHAPT